MLCLIMKKPVKTFRAAFVREIVTLTLMTHLGLLQCDQMTRLFAQYLAIHNHENLPNIIQYLPEFLQYFAKYYQIFLTFGQVAKFCQISGQSFKTFYGRKLRL